MTDVSGSPVWPEDLDALQAALAELAVGGVIAPPPGIRGWLASTGVTRTSADAHLRADDDWLAWSLPSATDDELMLRTLLRNPLYRLHLDLQLAEVVAAMGRSSRWARLEGLVFGELAVLAPRLAALIDFARTESGGWPPDYWRSLDLVPPGIAAELDKRCWGISGGPETLFPILCARYPAFAPVPVFFRAADPLVISIIAAAATGEAVRVAAESRTDLAVLARQGLPVWSRAIGDGLLEVTLSAPCRLRGGQGESEGHPCSYGVPALVRAGSTLLAVAPGDVGTSFWQIAGTRTPGSAFLGTSHRDAWPSDSQAACRGLPRGEDLANLVRARRFEPGARDPADDALRSLSDHPLYGFWIQVLLLEALDRELGEETLLITPPVHAIVDDPEAAAPIYYRPRSDAARQARAMRRLGTQDDIMTQLAVAVGLRPIAVLGDAAGPWSMALALLVRVGVAQTRHDRWALSTHVLDRLHGGGLMTGVIRRGREFRERLHAVLEDIWRERGGTEEDARSA